MEFFTTWAGGASSSRWLGSTLGDSTLPHPAKQCLSTLGCQRGASARHFLGVARIEKRLDRGQALPQESGRCVCTEVGGHVWLRIVLCIGEEETKDILVEFAIPRPVPQGEGNLSTIASD